jgi:hypothetical protein
VPPSWKLSQPCAGKGTDEKPVRGRGMPVLMHLLIDVVIYAFLALALAGAS